jgi:hypothetical protein
MRSLNIIKVFVLYAWALKESNQKMVSALYFNNNFIDSVTFFSFNKNTGLELGPDRFGSPDSALRLSQNKFINYAADHLPSNNKTISFWTY